MNGDLSAVMSWDGLGGNEPNNVRDNLRTDLIDEFCALCLVGLRQKLANIRHVLNNFRLLVRLIDNTFRGGCF